MLYQYNILYVFIIILLLLLILIIISIIIIANYNINIIIIIIIYYYYILNYFHYVFIIIIIIIYIQLYTSHPPFDPWVTLLWISIDRGFPHFLWQVDGRLLSSESAEWARADSDAGHAASKPAGRNEEAVRNGRGGQEMGIWPTKMVNHCEIYGNIMIFMVYVQSWYIMISKVSL